MKNVTSKIDSKANQILVQETTKEVCQVLKINYSKLKSKQKALLDVMIVALINLEIQQRNKRNKEILEQKKVLMTKEVKSRLGEEILNTQPPLEEVNYKESEGS